MSTAFIVILFVGLILMVGNAAKGSVTGAAADNVVYKYLPCDLDTYLREDANQPSILYKAMFSDEDIIR